MSTIFMGLEIGKRAVLTQQTALHVTGHNIANANTPGYSRQVGYMQTTTPFPVPSMQGSTRAGQMGTGVNIQEIERVRDAFLDQQIRKENRDAGYWSMMENTLSRIEVIVNEPSDESLRTTMDMFWESWQDLSVNPSSEAVRSVVAQRGMALADAFNHTYTQLTELREDLNASVKVQVSDINAMAKQIRDLNEQIMAIEITDLKPNDLQDKRDLLLDELSKMVNINYSFDKHGMVNIQVGGRNLIQGTEYTELSTKADNDGMYMVTWSDTDYKAQVTGGELGAVLNLRGKTENPQDSSADYLETIPDLLKDLNTLAKTIAVKTNEVHRGGYSLNNKEGYPDGYNFFNMPADVDAIDNWASYIKVHDLIISDVKNIAAAGNRTHDTAGEICNFGDGSNALKIAQLKQDFNNPRASVFKSDEAGLPFPVPINGNLTITYDGGGSVLIVNLDATYNDLSEIAKAIQEQIDTAGVEIEVACDGKSLEFSSTSVVIDSITDGGWGGLTFTAQTPPDLLEKVTTDDYWRSITAGVGVDSGAAQQMNANQEALVNQLENNRQSISGVSLDEEMTNLVKYQHAYNAASRFITVIDEALDVIINRMGTVGR